MRDLRPSAIYYARFSQGGDSGNGAGRSVATTTRPRDRTKPDADTVTIGDGKCGRKVFFGQKEEENINRDDGMMIRTSGDDQNDDKNIWTRAMLFGWTGLTVDR